jgi:hypothetical protein
MKLKVFEQEQEKEKEVILKLEEWSDGIVLIAVDEDGNKVVRGKLLRLQNNGMIHLYRAIDTDLGFQLDSKGRIKIEGVE